MRDGIYFAPILALCITRGNLVRRYPDARRDCRR
jgi:hypothetical protein